ncbi:hypothetical protein, partial [Escherichia coli]|uniref:hypothetical protein n=1 Tax=Escherichia coli TaxID=562 RepID=UPI001BDB8100
RQYGPRCTLTEKTPGPVNHLINLAVTKSSISHLTVLSQTHSKSHQVTSIGFELIHWALRKDTFLRLTTKTRKLRKG